VRDRGNCREVWSKKANTRTSGGIDMLRTDTSGGRKRKTSREVVGQERRVKKEEAKKKGREKEKNTLRRETKLKGGFQLQKKEDKGVVTL